MGKIDDVLSKMFNTEFNREITHKNFIFCSYLRYRWQNENYQNAAVNFT